MFKKIITKILTSLLLIGMLVSPANALGGEYTTNEYFYLPAYGASGTTEMDAYNAAMEVADNQIEANKDAIAAIVGDSLPLYYLKTEINTLSKVETIYGTDIVDTTELATYCETTQDYLKTSENDDDAASLANIKTACTDDFHNIGGTDANTTYTSSDFNHDDLTGFVANEHIDWTADQGAVNIHAGNYTDTDTTYTAGTGLDLTGTVFSSTITQYVDSDAITAIKGDESWNATDWDTAYGWGDWSGEGFISDITGENFADLADIPAHPAANNKILETLAGGTYQWIDTPSQLSDLSDVGVTTPTDKYVLVADGDSWESRAISSAELSDVDSIAMLDENETVTGSWDFNNGIYLHRYLDSNYAPYFFFYRRRDGDPTYNVSSGDKLGDIYFNGFYNAGQVAAEIRGLVDGTPGIADMPGRLEFLTSADGTSDDPTLRMTIDNAGNIKMGDGAWTNYANFSSNGVLTFEGTATINEPLSIMAATTSAELAGVISDETGSGALVFGTAPTLKDSIIFAGDNDSIIRQNGNTKEIAIASGEDAHTSDGAYFRMYANNYSGGYSEGVLGFYAGNVETGDIFFYTKATMRMRIRYDGKVGIGTTAPSGNLDLNVATDEDFHILLSENNTVKWDIYNDHNDDNLQVKSSTTLRYEFGTDGTAVADVAWNTFSPVVVGEGKELLAIALEDANKPVKPYAGIPIVKADSELYDIVKTEVQELVDKVDEEGKPVLTNGKPVQELVTKIKEEKVFRERRPDEFLTEEEKQAEWDKYSKSPAKISIANAKYLEYLTGVIDAMRVKIDELEARITILEEPIEVVKEVEPK